MPGEAELIMFAIRSGIKLGQQSREAYVDATRRRELMLPLPNFPTAITVDSAGGYFIGEGARHVKAPSRLADLVGRWNSRAALSADEEAELRVFRCECFVQDLTQAGLPVSAADASVFGPEDLQTLLQVRQWGRGTDPTPSALQRVGGTLIEIGVDYFATMPGALNAHSTMGKIAHAALAGLEPLKLSEIAIGELPGRLFVATLETVATNPGLLTGDPKVQELVTATSRGLAQDVGERIAMMRARGDSNSSREERVAEWGELVFRSVLGTGGRMVLENPKTFLGIKADGEAALVSDVGTSVLGLILSEPTGNLSRVFSRESVDVVMKAALIAVAKHPEMLVDKKDKGLHALLVSVASELGQYETLLTAALLPDVTKLILEKTGDNLELLWPEMAQSPKNHLLLTAAKTSLAILTKAPDGARWKPRFGRDDLLAVTRTVFDEVVQNPAWLLAAADGGDARLKIALEAALDVLRARGTQQLGLATATAVLQASIRTVALRAEFLERMPAGRPLAGKPILAAALDVTLKTMLQPPGPRAAWRLARADAVAAVVRLCLGELARCGPSADRVGILDTFVQEQAAAIEAGKTWDLDTFATGLRKGLGA
jgi:hypothetical protein